MRDEREDFGEISLGHGYRLVRRDARNWEMQHWHIPDQDSRLTRHDDGCWYQTGNYFQQLDAAVLWACERVLHAKSGPTVRRTSGMPWTRPARSLQASRQQRKRRRLHSADMPVREPAMTAPLPAACRGWPPERMWANLRR